MRKILFVLLFVVAVPMLASAYEDSGIRFSDLHGQVAVRPDEEFDDAYEYADLETKLRYNDRIWTEIDSGAILSLADMSTFVIKENTVMVLPKPETQVSSIKILSGNVWVNMKKMVEGGEFHVELNQAVAGIKGTILTCRTGDDFDRIVCAQGRVQVRSKKTGEIVEIGPGEQVIVGGDKPFEREKADLDSLEKEWQEDLDKMGSSLRNDELTDVLTARADLIQNQVNDLNKLFESVSRKASLQQNDLNLLERAARNISSELAEAKTLASQAQARGANADKPDRVMLVAAAKLTSLAAQAEAKVAAVLNFIKRSLVNLHKNPDNDRLDMLAEKAESLMAEFNQIRKEMETANGKSQSWFEDRTQEISRLLEYVARLSEEASELSELFPGDPKARAISMTVGNMNKELARLLYSSRVVPIDYAAIDMLKNYEENISDSIEIYNREWDKYNNIDKESTTAQSKILAQSLRILGGFAKVKRQYDRAKRLYSGVMRSAASSRFKTAEHLEFEDLWKRVQDNFMSLSDLAGILQSRIEDLQNRINSSGKLRR